MNRKLAVLCALAALLLLLAGCGRQNALLRIGIGTDPQTLDPRKAVSRQDELVASQLFEGLTCLDESGVVKPAVAESWEESADGREYVFHLRKDAKWSDGSAVTAADFEYSWKSHLAPDFSSATASQLYFIKNSEAYNKGNCQAGDVGVSARDEYTIAVQLENPVPFFAEIVSRVAYMPVHKILSGSNKALFSGPVEKIPCNGAYRLVSWKKGDRIGLKANEFYYDRSNVHEKAAEFVAAGSAAAQLSLFQSDALDLMFNPPVQDVEYLKAQGVLRVHPVLGTKFFSFNNQKALFADARVRQAFCLALNRQQLIDSALKCGQQPALALVAPGMPDSDEDKDFRAVGGDYFKDNDVNAARKLFAQAGYPNGRNFPGLFLLCSTADADVALAHAAKVMWENTLGVHVNIVSKDRQEFLTALDNYDFVISSDGWRAEYCDPYAYLVAFSKTDGGLAKANYDNDHYDSLLMASSKITNRTARFKMLHEAEDLLMQSYAIIPVYYYSDSICISGRVKPFEYNNLGDIYIKNIKLD